MTGTASPPGLSLINAGFREGDVGSLRVVGTRIAALNERPHRGDLVIDLEGDRVLPGLINAHDHLQLNSLPCLGRDKRYAHVRQWIADINRRRQSDAEFESQVKVARRTRLLVGGIKNLFERRDDGGASRSAVRGPSRAELSGRRGCPLRLVALVVYRRAGGGSGVPIEAPPTCCLGLFTRPRVSMKRRPWNSIAWTPWDASARTPCWCTALRSMRLG